MNIVKQIEEVRRLCERVKSARFDAQRYVIPAINLATQKWHDDGCDYFQQNQEIRDYMAPLVIHRLALTPLNTNEITYPADYSREVAFAIVVDGKEMNCPSTSYNSINNMQRNSFTRVNGKWPALEQGYKIEGNGKQYVTFPGTNFTTSYLSYIRQFIPAAKSDTLITAGPTVLTAGVMYYVNATTVTHNAIVYAVGATFVAANTTFTGTGNVFSIQNCEIGADEHEGICQYAAADLLQNIEKFTNAQFKERESKN